MVVTLVIQGGTLARENEMLVINVLLARLMALYSQPETTVHFLSAYAIAQVRRE